MVQIRPICPNADPGWHDWQLELRHLLNFEKQQAMNCNRLKIVFAGTPEFAAVALGALISSDHDIVGVLTQPDRPAGRGRKLTASAVKTKALSAGLQVMQPENLKDSTTQEAIDRLGADVIVVAAYGLILPQAILDLPAMGCLNIHASLLPRWRGAAPIHRAILAGDEHTGVCIMQMQAGLDTGDILLEKRCSVSPDESVNELHDRLAILGAEALIESLPAHCQGLLMPKAQSSTGITYAHKLTKSEAGLDFSASSSQIHRQVRAYNPWPVAEALLCGERVRIWASRLVHETEVIQGEAYGTVVSLLPDALRVRTGDGYLDLLTLQWPGKKAQSAASFAQGKALSGQNFTLLADANA